MMDIISLSLVLDDPRRDLLVSIMSLVKCENNTFHDSLHFFSFSDLIFNANYLAIYGFGPAVNVTEVISDLQAPILSFCFD